MSTLALIGLGSNVGDRAGHLNRAVDALDDTPGVEVVGLSSYHATKPVGGPSGQGAFLNAAARLDTDLEPHDLLDVLHEIEDGDGRVRTVRWGERTIDLDLLVYGCKRINSDGLIVPHPRMAVRRFVLAPLAEIAAEVVDMQSGKTIHQLLTNLDRRPSYVALDAPPGPFRDEIFRRVVSELPSIGLTESAVLANSHPYAFDGADVWLSRDWSPEAWAKVRHLRSEEWERRLGTDRWLVTDFCESKYILGHERSRYTPKGVPRPEPMGDNMLQLSEWLLPPTFVVAVTGGLFDTFIPRGLEDFGPGRSFRKGDVLLFPESDTPGEIAREIVSACTATRT